MSNLSTAGNLSVAGTMAVSGVSTLSAALNVAASIAQSGSTAISTGSLGLVTNILSYSAGVVNMFVSAVSSINLGYSSSSVFINGPLSCTSTVGVSGLLTANSMSANAIVCSIPAAVTNLFTNAGATINMGNSGFGTTLNSSQLLLPTGGISLSAAPAVSAYLNGTSITLPSGTFTLAKFDTVEYQVGSGYSTATGIFTVPWTGFYAITGALNLQGTGIANSFSVIFKNGSYYRKGQQIGVASANGSVFSEVVKLDAGDTIGIYGFAASGSSMTIYNGGGAKDTYVTITYLRS